MTDPVREESGVAQQHDELPGSAQPVATKDGKLPDWVSGPFFERIHLLEMSRTKWQYGEWRALSETALESIEDHPDRAKIAILIGAAKAHLGEVDTAKAMIQQAMLWGCNRELAARVLASMIHNSLGRLAVSLEDDPGATRHFEAAIGLVEPRADAPLLARTRRVRETAKMGLLPDAAKLLGEDLSAMEAAPIDHAARLAAVRTEVNILGRELAYSGRPISEIIREMSDHPIFDRFSRMSSETTGLHIFDFLGGATSATFNRNLAKFVTAANKTVTPNLPPKNEHYLDWIAVLTAASKAEGVFRMAEFGAGWAPWLVRGALAVRQRPEVHSLELLAVEADPTHYAWARQHFSDNGLDPDHHHVIHGAVTEYPGALRFPVIAEPDVHYGASLTDAETMEQTIEVQGHTIAALLQRFSGPLDFLHVDIQGAEHSTIPPAMALLSQSVRSIMIGTHDGEELHDKLANLFLEYGWRERLNLGGVRTNRTPWGEIKTDDGFLWFENDLA